MNLGLEGRRALVGGATSGLGAAIADALAAEGCSLMLWSRDEERLRASAEAIAKRHGVEAGTVAADAGVPGAAEAVAERAEQALGGVDVLVLNAGGPPPVDPLQTTDEGWRAALELLLLTPVALASALIPGMRERGWGRVLAVLSSGIAEPIPNLVYSNAARSALASWLKTVSGQVAADGVTVNGVVPGRIATPRVAALDERQAEADGATVEEVRQASEQRIPVARYGRPEELAAVAVLLCSDRAGYTTGTLARVDGGMVSHA